ncbi:hypothetical protein [Brevundimonas goettingensis]|uniref:Uncharacterized protein n=1 Tax=Brevundimonas goettingensis TaxID=2774190 RepID=A0A975C8F8_9CAUL|nr:hypothetical protein [Brevundimonas goettingensis]QTC93051.1 hypothetical protein IFJ75_09505 [Brevundimonas goettingensis]
MTVTGDLEHPVVSFLQARKPVDICVSSLEVREHADRSFSGKLVWEVQTESGCIALDSIAYGQAPAGFRTIHAPESLKPGIVYEAFGRGATTGMFGASAAGSALFTYHDGSWWEPTGTRP